MPRKMTKLSRQSAPLGSVLKTGSGIEGERAERLLTPKEAANFLRVSESWLAKARMRGDGPPYVKLGRSIRYREGDPGPVDEISSAAVDQRAVGNDDA